MPKGRPKKAESKKHAAPPLAASSTVPPLRKAPTAERAYAYGIVEPGLAYTLEGLAKTLGTTPRWVREILLYSGAIPILQVSPRSPILISGRHFVDWVAKKSECVGKEGEATPGREPPHVHREGVYTSHQLELMFNLPKLTVHAWIEGNVRVRGGLKTLNRALRHFRDGKLILVRHEWLAEFLEANSEVLADELDDLRKGEQAADERAQPPATQ